MPSPWWRSGWSALSNSLRRHRTIIDTLRPDFPSLPQPCLAARGRGSRVLRESSGAAPCRGFGPPHRCGRSWRAAAAIRARARSRCPPSRVRTLREALRFPSLAGRVADLNALCPKAHRDATGRNRSATHFCDAWRRRLDRGREGKRRSPDNPGKSVSPSHGVTRGIGLSALSPTQYSSGNRIVVTDLSLSVMTQTLRSSRIS